MNGNEIRPITAQSTRTVTMFGLRDGTRHDFEPGDELTGYVNEHGNVYTKEGAYVGSIGSGWEEVTE